jgi:8-oxo-dGTP diphosphatase
VSEPAVTLPSPDALLGPPEVDAVYDAAAFMAVAVDVVVLTIRRGQLAVLLVWRQQEGGGSWALLRRFVLPDEDLDAAAHRELEDIGLASLPVGGHLEQLRTCASPGRDPGTRVVSVAYLGLLPELSEPQSSREARWLAVADLTHLAADGRCPVALDQWTIIADGVERARAKLEYSSLATALCDEPFTLADLRRVYETVWGARLDVANFRRKVLSTPGLVEPLGRRTAPASGGRPAELYRPGPARTLHPPIPRPVPAR